MSASAVSAKLFVYSYNFFNSLKTIAIIQCIIFQDHFNLF